MAGGRFVSPDCRYAVPSFHEAPHHRAFVGAAADARANPSRPARSWVSGSTRNVGMSASSLVSRNVSSTNPVGLTSRNSPSRDASRFRDRTSAPTAGIDSRKSGDVQYHPPTAPVDPARHGFEQRLRVVRDQERAVEAQNQRLAHMSYVDGQHRDTPCTIRRTKNLRGLTAHDSGVRHVDRVIQITRFREGRPDNPRETSKASEAVAEPQADACGSVGEGCPVRSRGRRSGHWRRVSGRTRRGDQWSGREETTP